MNIFGQCYKLEFDAATENEMAFLDGVKCKKDPASGCRCDWTTMRRN